MKQQFEPGLETPCPPSEGFFLCTFHTMEFRLPTELANKLVDYDQTLKVIKPRREQREVVGRLKRKTKLSFPCPEIFFDLTVDEVYEIYEELCYRPTPLRYHTVYSNVNPMNTRYLIAWNKCPQTKVETWYCWKVGNKECPIILRYWDETFADDEYNQFRSDSSLKDFHTTKDNPFRYRYKAEQKRSDAFSSFISAVRNQVELPSINNNLKIATNLEMYGVVNFFYQQYFLAKNEHSFHPAKWLSNQNIHTLTEAQVNLKTNSTIINSKFFQNEVRKEAALLKENVFTEPVNTQRIIHKLSYIYLFLTLFPDEYDRSIHLYNQMSEYDFSSRWSTWGVFHKLEYMGDAFSRNFMDWLRSKLTPQMFANWILEEIQIKQKREYDNTIRDTVEMLVKVWRRTSYLTESNPEYLKEPKRWRLLDAHDHYVGVTFQMDNQMKNLPTDLIPEPVTFETEVGTIRMFQPTTNHEVIRWGKAVRNCVGSAGYSDRVLNRSAFLVFAERNQKPWLTSLLTLDMGMLHVGQTVSPFNASPAPEEREVYERCLQHALGIAEE